MPYFQEFLIRKENVAWNGATAPSASGFYAIITDSSSYTVSSSIEDVLPSEELNSIEYARTNVNPGTFSWDGVNNRVAAATIACTFTAGANSITGDRVCILSDTDANANRTVTTIVSDALNITGIGALVATDDRVVFSSTSTYPTGISANTIYYIRDDATDSTKIAATAGGAAIALGTSWSGTLSIHLVKSSGLVFYSEQAIAIAPSGTKTFNLVIAGQNV